MRIQTSNISDGIARAMPFLLLGYLLMLYLYPDIGRSTNFFYFTALPLSLVYGALRFRDFPWHDRLLLLNILTLIYFTLAVLWSDEGFREQQKLMRRGVYLATFFIAVWIAWGAAKISIRQFLVLIVGISLLSASISLAFHWYEHGITLQRMVPVLIPQPLFGAAAYGLGFVSGLYLLCTSSRRYIAAYSVALVPLAVAIVLTQSRGPGLGVAAAIVAMWFLPGVDRRRWTAILAALIFATVLLAMITPIGQSFLDRGSSYRLDIWASSLADVQDHLWFGRGWTLDDSVTTPVGTFDHTHSIFIGALRYAGLFGIILLTVTMSRHISIAFSPRNADVGPVGLWLVFSLGYLTTDLTYVITRPGLVWVLLWFPLLTICYWRDKDQTQPIERSEQSGSSAVRPLA